MKIKRILVCDGSVDGIFTAIYQAYDMRYGHENIKIVEQDADGGMNFELFSEYIDVTTDHAIAEKVARSIRTKISKEAYEAVVRSALSSVEGRSDVIYRFLILGFHMGKAVMGHLSNDVVNQIFSMSRNVGMETHHMTGFVRFMEVGDGVLLSVIKPKNHIISLLAPHFADRLNNEDFIIYDEGRGWAAVHRKNTEPVLMQLDEEAVRQIKNTKTDAEEYEQLWRAFYKSISIEERENYVLLRTNLPLRFRAYMTEFEENVKNTGHKPWMLEEGQKNVEG